MADDEWYRSGDWTPEAQETFRRRLGRARTDSRPQYLALKGHALHEAGEVVAARSLWREVLDHPADEGYELDRLRALDALARSLAEDEPADPVEAEQRFREMIARNPRRQWSDMQYVGLAELLIDRGREADLAEADALLRDWRHHTRTPFPAMYFRWNLAVIGLAEATGDRNRARHAAREALDLASRGPAIPRLKSAGVVHADDDVLDRLRQIAES